MPEQERAEDELWCAHCNRLVERGSLQLDDAGARHCPRCGSPIDADAPVSAGIEEEGPPKAPWHFKVLLVGTVVYLVYRLIWFILWLSRRA